jgi:hypothetical protein
MDCNGGLPGFMALLRLLKNAVWPLKPSVKAIFSGFFAANVFFRRRCMPQQLRYSVR